MERLSAILILVSIGAAGIAGPWAPAAALAIITGLTGALVAHLVGVPEDPEDWARIVATGFHFGVMVGGLLGVGVIGLKANRLKGHRVWPSRWTGTIILLSALVVTSLPVRIDLFMIAALMWFSPVEGVRGAAAPATAKRDDEGRAQA